MDFDKNRKKTQNVQKNIKFEEFICLVLGLRRVDIKTINSSNK